MRVGNDVLENESLLGVLEDTLERALSSLLHGGVHFLNGHVALQHGHEVGQRTGGGGNAEGSAVKQTLELGNHLTDSLGSAGGGGDDVDSSCAHTAGIAVRQVKDALVVGVGVDGAHHALLDTPLVIENLNHGGKAVSGAGSVGHDVVLLSIVLVVVDADAESQVGVLSGSGDKNLLGAGLDVTLSLLTSGEETGGLKNNVNTQLSPGELIRTQHTANNLDGVAVYNEVVTVDLDGAVELALRGVILEQVSGGSDGGKVVDGNNLLELGLGHGAKHVAADASETVNSVFSHNSEMYSLSCLIFPPSHPAQQGTDILPPLGLGVNTNLLCTRKKNPTPDAEKKRCDVPRTHAVQKISTQFKLEERCERAYDERAHVMNFEPDSYAAPKEQEAKTWPTRLTGAGTALLCTALAAALLSYKAEEASWAFLNPASAEAAAAVPCTNWLGIPGLYLAGLLQALLGGAALYAMILTGIVGLGLAISPQTSRVRQWISMGIMVLCACTFLDMQESILQGWTADNHLKSEGGYIGYLFGACILAAIMGNVWASVLVISGHGTALMFFARVSPRAVAIQAWADFRFLSLALWGGLVRLCSRKSAKENKPTPVKEAEEDTDWKNFNHGSTTQPHREEQPEQPPYQPAPQHHPRPQQQQPLPIQQPREEQPAEPQQQPPFPRQRPTIQTAPPPLRRHEPDVHTAAHTDIDAPPAALRERLNRAEEEQARRPAVQQPPTGRARRPQQPLSHGDNLLDLMRPIEESIERRNSPGFNEEYDDDDAPRSRRTLSPAVLAAMNRHLGLTDDEDEEDAEKQPESVPTPPEPRRDAAPQVPVRKQQDIPAPQPVPPSQPPPRVPMVPRREPTPREPIHSLPQDTRTHLEDYPLPPYDLLNFVPVADEDSEAAREEMYETQQCIIETLATFKIKVEPGDITRGPSITRYEFYPPKGLRLKQITNLADNLKLAAQAKSINILAPIPGKNTIGIELENAIKAPVFLRELLQSEAFHSKKLRIPVALGKDVYGNPVIGDLAAMPHTLVAGTTGSGKSVCVNSMILSMLYKFRPDELRLILVDPKVVEMQPYKRLPHLACPVVTNAARVIGALRWAVNEMEHRYKLFSKIGVRNFEDFNNRPEDFIPEPDEDEMQEHYTPLPEGYDAADAIVRDIESSQGIEEMEEEEQGEFDFDQDEQIPAKLPYIVIIIDELADLMMQVKEDLENYIARLTQKARAAGIHLVAATQTPRANVITGIIKANIPSRLAFKVASPLDSRVILDTNGAENLLGKGDFLFLPPGGITKITRAQGAFVSDPEIASIVKFCAAHAKQNFVQGVTAEMNNADGSGPSDDGGRLGGNGMSDEDAELYTRCVQLVITERKASTSLLQRRFSIGYGRAAKIMDMMEQRGVIGPASGNTSRPREVLIEAP